MKVIAVSSILLSIVLIVLAALAFAGTFPFWSGIVMAMAAFPLLAIGVLAFFMK